MDTPTLERNLRRYGLYAVLCKATFWAPVFFLYLNQRFSIEQILALHGLYYAAVVVLEVPSGYLSDRMSRTLTLRLSALGGIAATLLFLTGGDVFSLFVAAQIGNAIFYAFLSGTDAAFHYDTLDALGRGGELAEREARLGRNGFLAASACAVLGGAAGMIDLRAPYLLSLAVGIAILVVVLGMREPPRHQKDFAHARFLDQVREALRHTRKPFLAWLFAYVILQVTLEHLPYEFAQPYTALALGEPIDQLQRTPLVTGFIAAAIAAVGALAAAKSAALGKRFGIVRTLIAASAVQTGLIALMATVVHVAVLPFIALRSTLPAIGGPLVRAAVAPRIPQAQRATYLSLQSLAGRLGYSSVLFVLSDLVGGEAAAGDPVLSGLRASAGLALLGLVLLVLFSRRAVE